MNHSTSDFRFFHQVTRSEAHVVNMYQRKLNSTPKQGSVTRASSLRDQTYLLPSYSLRLIFTSSFFPPQPVTPYVQSKHKVFWAHNLWQITARGRWLLDLINYESALSHLLSPVGNISFLGGCAFRLHTFVYIKGNFLFIWVMESLCTFVCLHEFLWM